MWKILCTLLFVASSSPAWGQAMTVFGQTDGSHCYELSRDGYSPKQAIDICTRALKGVLSGSDRAYTLVNRSINYNLLGEYDEALEDIDAAFEIIPDLPEAYLSRGNTYFLQKMHEAAIEEYTIAIDNDVDDAHKAYFNRALAHESLKNYENAFADFLSAISESPSFLPAIERVALYRNQFKTSTWIS